MDQMEDSLLEGGFTSYQLLRDNVIYMYQRCIFNVQYVVGFICVTKNLTDRKKLLISQWID